VYDVLTVRVAARHQWATEFPSEQAKKQYLQEHPGADPANHTVKNPGEGAGDSRAPSEKAKNWLSRAVGDVKSFFSDAKVRKEGLAKASAKLKEAPRAAGLAAVEAVKKQVAEAKDAFAGMKSLMSGGTMTEPQKVALKRVAVKTATALVSTALVAAFPAAVAHSLVSKQIAKTVSKTVMNKILGQATGIKLATDESLEAKFGETMALAVSEALENLSEDDLREILEGVAQDSQ
jgi:hypothetical protein